MELKRSLSQRLKTTLGLSQLKNKASQQASGDECNKSDNIAPIDSSDISYDEGIQTMRYDEIDPTSSINSSIPTSNSAPQMKKKTSTTSLPALLKRNKSFIGGNRNASSNLSGTISENSSTNVLNRPTISSSTPNVYNASGSNIASKRQSLSSITTPFTNILSGNRDSASSSTAASNHHHNLINTNTIHNELVKALSLNNDSFEGNPSFTAADALSSTISKPTDKNDLKLDLLPPIPLKSPSSGAQLSPVLPSRLTTPILESEAFFSNTPSVDGDSNNDLDQHVLMQSFSSSIRRSRQNSSATSFSSHTTNNFPKTPIGAESFGANNSSILLNFLNDPVMNNVVVNNKDLINGEIEPSGKGELEDACCDEIAMNILDKVSSNVSLTQNASKNTSSPYFMDGVNGKGKRSTEWCI